MSLIAIANARGVRVVMVHEGDFAAAFSEVNFRMKRDFPAFLLYAFGFFFYGNGYGRLSN